MHLSKTAPHTRLSPAYLFQQSIDPNNLEKGLNGLKFYQQCRQSLTPHGLNDILVTFAMRHLTVLNGLALQNLESFNVLRPFNHAIDLKTAIATCHYFGEQQIPFVRNLKQAATLFKFSGNINNHLERLDALQHIYTSLMQREPKIMSFLLKSKSQLSTSITSSQSPYFVHIDEKGRLCLLKCLVTSPDGVYIKSLCAHAGSVELVVLNLEMMPLIAPLSILTKERQERLHFDVQEYIQRLEQVNLQDFASDKDTNNVEAIGQWQDKDRFFYERFLYQLTTANELNVFNRSAFTPLTEEEIKLIPSLSPELKRMMVFYQFENFPEQRTSELEALYTKFVTEQTRMREPVIMQECTLLRDNMADYSEQELASLKRVFEYFSR